LFLLKTNLSRIFSICAAHRRLTGGAQAAVEAGVKKAQSAAAQAAAQAAAKEMEKQISAGFGAVMGRRK